MGIIDRAKEALGITPETDETDPGIRDHLLGDEEPADERPTDEPTSPAQQTPTETPQPTEDEFGEPRRARP